MFISDPTYVNGEKIYWAHHNILFEACGSNAGEILWKFGDGEQARGFTKTHSYQAPGTYKVQLITTTGGQFDTQYSWINVKEKLLYRVTIRSLAWIDENNRRWDKNDGPDVGMVIKDHITNDNYSLLIGNNIDTMLPLSHYLEDDIALPPTIDIKLVDHDNGKKQLMHLWGGYQPYSTEDNPIVLQTGYWWDGAMIDAYEIALHYTIK